MVGGRRLALRVCRVLACVATGLPFVMFACAFLPNADEDGRSSGMLAVASITLLVASLSCWIPVWYFRERKGPPESNPGLNREGPQD